MIVIRDFKMPKCCEDCLIEQNDEDSWGYTYNFRCPLIDQDTEKTRETKRLPDCPILDVYIPVA